MKEHKLTGKREGTTGSGKGTGLSTGGKCYGDALYTWSRDMNIFYDPQNLVLILPVNGVAYEVKLCIL